MGEEQLRVEDIGTLSGAVLIYGGPYSNVQATRALFDRADTLGVLPENRICTGDMIAYCADPVATVKMIAARGGPVVAGNTERQLATNAQDCGCGFEQGTTCDLLSRGWYPFALACVAGDKAVRARLASCPDMIVFTHQGRRHAVVHGGLTDVARFLWPVSPEAEFAQEIDAITSVVGHVDCVVAGHCGIPFSRNVGGVAWINASVIGMPPHDGTPATRFAVLGEDGVQVETLDYDAGAAADAMRAAGLTQGYELALTTGHWPSEDVLPTPMRNRDQGRFANG